MMRTCLLAFAFVSHLYVSSVSLFRRSLSWLILSQSGCSTLHVTPCFFPPVKQCLVSNHFSPQSQSAQTISVGFQHTHSSMSRALTDVVRTRGFFALWTGVTAAIPRVTVGSAVQLTTFSYAKEIIETQSFSQDSESWYLGASHSKF